MIHWKEQIIQFEDDTKILKKYRQKDCERLKKKIPSGIMTVPRKGKGNLKQRNTNYCIEMSKSTKKASLNYSVET